MKLIRRFLSLLLIAVIFVTPSFNVLPYAHAVSQVHDLKIECANTLYVIPGKTYPYNFFFSGKGIDSVSLSTTAITAKITNVQWKAYPAKCPVTIQISANQTGNYTFYLKNNQQGTILQKTVTVLAKTNDSKQVDAKYTVSHPKGVNVRALPNTNSAIKNILSKGSTFPVTFIQGNWGYTGSGFVCLDYCTRTDSSPTNSSSGSNGYAPTAALRFAAEHVYSSSCGLCAEYVCRCLISGGLDLPIIKGCRQLHNALLKTKGVKRYRLTVEANGSILPRKNKGKIAPGDPIIMYCTSCLNIDGEPYTHAVLVSTLSNSGIRVYARNHSYNNETYYGFSSCGSGSGHNVEAYSYHFT